MLLRECKRRARSSGERLRSSVPKRRSNTARGLVSGGMGEVGVRQESVLLQAQL